MLRLTTTIKGKVGKGVRAQTHNVRGTQGLFNTENNTYKTKGKLTGGGNTLLTNTRYIYTHITLSTKHTIKTGGLPPR